MGEGFEKKVEKGERRQTKEGEMEDALGVGERRRGKGRRWRFAVMRSGERDVGSEGAKGKQREEQTDRGGEVRERRRGKRRSEGR